MMNELQASDLRFNIDAPPPSRADLELARRYEVLLDHITSILADCPSVHIRKCRDCGNVAYHADNITPHVLCKKCGSQDTRKVKT
jgi:hypothetical protein